MDTDIFIAKCKDILARKGEDVPHAIVMGYIGISARQYTDDIITISSATHNGKELFEVVVRYKARYDDREIDIENPCLMVIDGELIRYHGDCHHYAEPQVEKLTLEV